MHFPNVDSQLSVIDVEIFLCYGLTYAKLARALRSGLNGAAFHTLPGEEALRQVEKACKATAGVHCWARISSKHTSSSPQIEYAEVHTRDLPTVEQLKDPADLADCWDLDALANHFRRISKKATSAVDVEGRPAKKRANAAAAPAPAGKGAARSAFSFGFVFLLLG